MVHSNIFTQKMHQIRQKKQNAAKENESNPAEEKMRSRGEGDSERRRGRRSFDERRGRCDRPTSGAIDDRDRAARQSTIAIASLIDRRAVRVRRARSSIAPLERRSRRAISSIAIVDRASRRRGAIVGQAARSRLSLLSLSLSNLGSLFSLSLPLSLSGSYLK